MGRAIRADWHHAWRGGHVKLYQRGRYFKHVPISQADGEALITGGEAAGTQWLIANCMDLDDEDTITHTGNPPWTFGELGSS